MKKRLLLILFYALCSSPFSQAQNTDEQLWFEYFGELPFANSFNLENSLTYRTVVQGPNTPKWRSFDYTPTLEYGLNKYLDFKIGTAFSYTQQTTDYNTFEIRPFIGTRIHFTPNKRVLLRTQLRLEYRNFKNLETGEWEQATRPRVRVESIIPLNRKSYFENKQWYALLDAEWLMKVDPDVTEYYANRFRLRVGLGYRLNYSFRFEFIYMNQQSRDGINETLHSNDNIFRFRLKHYFGRIGKPTSSDNDN